MNRMRRMFLTAFLLLLPAMSFAMEETVWNFRDGQLPGSWRISGLDLPTSTSDGLHVTASTGDGSMISDVKLSHPTEVVSLTFLSAVNTQAQFLWHQRDKPNGVFTQLNISIPAGEMEQTLQLNVDAYPQWDRSTDVIGLVFPKGTNLLLREIRFSHWNTLEKIAETWKSFWRFEAMTPMSINFLWGPVIAYNPLGTAELFSTMPPRGRSGNWIFFGAILLAACGCIGYGIWKKRKESAVVLFFLGISILWIGYDIRMGLELLSYARHDYVSYLTAPEGQRTFRTFLNFNDMLEQSLPLLHNEEKFAFLTSPGSPVLPMLRYFALPAEAVVPTGPRSDLHLWFLFSGDNVTIGSDNRIHVNGVPWSGTGKVLKSIDGTPFLFETNQ